MLFLSTLIVVFSFVLTLSLSGCTPAATPEAEDSQEEVVDDSEEVLEENDEIEEDSSEEVSV